MIKNTASERIADMRGKPETLANTKESAIIMIADIIESTTKSFDSQGIP